MGLQIYSLLPFWNIFYLMNKWRNGFNSHLRSEEVHFINWWWKPEKQRYENDYCTQNQTIAYCGSHLPIDWSSATTSVLDNWNGISWFLTRASAKRILSAVPIPCTWTLPHNRHLSHLRKIKDQYLKKDHFSYPTQSIILDIFRNFPLNSSLNSLAFASIPVNISLSLNGLGIDAAISITIAYLDIHLSKLKVPQSIPSSFLSFSRLLRHFQWRTFLPLDIEML